MQGRVSGLEALACVFPATATATAASGFGWRDKVCRVPSVLYSPHVWHELRTCVGEDAAWLVLDMLREHAVVEVPGDAEVEELKAVAGGVNQRPVVLRQASMFQAAVRKWTVHRVGGEVLDAEAETTVFQAQYRETDGAKHGAVFKYWSEQKAASTQYEFIVPSLRHAMKAGDFSALLEDVRRAEDVADEFEQRWGPKMSPFDCYYMQTDVSTAPGAGIRADAALFEWARVGAIKDALEWGSITAQLLFAGAANSVTPLHYDEQDVLIAVLSGVKMVVLHPPGDVKGLFPYPVAHPCDRQSQVDPTNVDWERFARFSETTPWECVLRPGDVLLIPAFWWHNVVNVEETVSLSLAFQVDAPSSQAMALALMRNVERSAYGPSRLSPHQVNRVLQAAAHLTDESVDADGVIAPANPPQLRKLGELAAALRALCAPYVDEQALDGFFRAMIRERYDRVLFA